MSAKPLVLDGPHGRIEVAVDALESIAAVAAAGVAGVEVARGRRAVEVVADPDGATAQVNVTAAAGHELPDLGEAVQRAVADALAATTALPVRVDVTVVGLTT